MGKLNHAFSILCGIVNGISEFLHVTIIVNLKKKNWEVQWYFGFTSTTCKINQRI